MNEYEFYVGPNEEILVRHTHTNLTTGVVYLRWVTAVGEYVTRPGGRHNHEERTPDGIVVKMWMTPDGSHLANDKHNREDILPDGSYIVSWKKSEMEYARRLTDDHNVQKVFAGGLVIKAWMDTLTTFIERVPKHNMERIQDDNVTYVWLSRDGSYTQRQDGAHNFEEHNAATGDMTKKWLVSFDIYVQLPNGQHNREVVHALGHRTRSWMLTEDEYALRPDGLCNPEHLL